MKRNWNCLVGKKVSVYRFPKSKKEMNRQTSGVITDVSVISVCGIPSKVGIYFKPTKDSFLGKLEDDWFMYFNEMDDFVDFIKTGKNRVVDEKASYVRKIEMFA